jgi:hypothetical protein
MADQSTSGPSPVAGGFAIHRDRLAHAMRRNHGDGVGTRAGLESFADGGLAQKLVGALRFAEQQRTIAAPAGVELIVDECAHRLLVALCEDRRFRQRTCSLRLAAGLPGARHVGVIIDAIDLTGADPDHRSIDVVVAALTALCLRANELWALLQLLEDAESDLSDRIAKPVATLTFTQTGETSSGRVSAFELFAERREPVGRMWALLIAALESGQAADAHGPVWHHGPGWRNLIVDQGDKPHLARQLAELRAALISEGDDAAGELYPPEGGFERYADPAGGR